MMLMFVVFPLAVGGGRLDGDPFFALEIHEVHGGADAVFALHFVNGVNRSV